MFYRLKVDKTKWNKKYHKFDFNDGYSNPFEKEVLKEPGVMMIIKSNGWELQCKASDDSEWTNVGEEDYEPPKGKENVPLLLDTISSSIDPTNRVAYLCFKELEKVIKEEIAKHKDGEKQGTAITVVGDSEAVAIINDLYETGIKGDGKISNPQKDILNALVDRMTKTTDTPPADAPPTDNPPTEPKE